MKISYWINYNLQEINLRLFIIWIIGKFCIIPLDKLQLEFPSYIRMEIRYIQLLRAILFLLSIRSQTVSYTFILNSLLKLSSQKIRELTFQP